MFKRILKISGIVLAVFIGLIGIAFGIMAIRGDFSNRKIKPETLFFVNDAGEKINSMYYTDEVFYDESGEIIDKLYFIVDADPENVNVLDVDVIISSEVGQNLIGFADENGDLQSFTTAQIGKKTYFDLLPFSESLPPDGIAYIQARANDNTVSSQTFTIYIDRAVKGITIKDTLNLNNNNIEIDDYGQLVSLDANHNLLYAEEVQTTDTDASEKAVSGKIFWKPISGTVIIKHGNVTITDNGASVLTAVSGLSGNGQIDYATGVFSYTLTNPNVSNPVVNYEHNGVKTDEQAQVIHAPAPKPREINLLLGQEYNLQSIFAPTYSKKPMSTRAAKNVEYFITNTDDKNYGDFKDATKTSVVAKSVGSFVVTVGTYATYSDAENANTTLPDNERLSQMVNSKIIFNVANIDIQSISITTSSLQLDLFEETSLMLNSTLAGSASADYSLGIDMFNEQSERVNAKFNEIRFVTSMQEYETVMGLYYGTISSDAIRNNFVGSYLMFVQGNGSEAVNVTDKFTIANPTGANAARTWVVTPNVFLDNLNLQFVVINSELSDQIGLIHCSIGVADGTPTLNVGAGESLPLEIAQSQMIPVDLAEITGITPTATYKTILYFINTVDATDEQKDESGNLLPSYFENIPISYFKNLRNGNDILIGYLDSDLNFVTSSAIPSNIANPIGGQVKFYAVAIRTDNLGNWFDGSGNMITLYFELAEHSALQNDFLDLFETESQLKQAYISNNLTTYQLQQLYLLVENLSDSNESKQPMINLIRSAIAKSLDLNNIIVSGKSNNSVIEVVFPIHDISVGLYSMTAEGALSALKSEDDDTAGEYVTETFNGSFHYYLREYYTTSRELTHRNPVVVFEDTGTKNALMHAAQSGNYELSIEMINSSGQKITGVVVAQFADFVGSLSPVVGGQNKKYYIEIDIKQKPTFDCTFKVVFKYLEYDSFEDCKQRYDSFTIISSAIQDYIIDPAFIVEGTYSVGTGIEWTLYRAQKDEDKNWVKKLDDQGNVLPGEPVLQNTDIFADKIDFAPAYALNYQHSYELTSDSHSDVLNLTYNAGIPNFEFLKEGTIKLKVEAQSGYFEDMTIVVLVPVKPEFRVETSSIGNEEVSMHGEIYRLIYVEVDLANYIVYKINNQTLSSEYDCEIVSVKDNSGADVKVNGEWAVTIANKTQLVRNTSKINTDLYVKVKVNATFCDPIYVLIALSNPVQIQATTSGALTVYEGTKYAFGQIVTAQDANTDAFVRIVNNTGEVLPYGTSGVNLQVFKDEVQLSEAEVSALISFDELTQTIIFNGLAVGNYKINFVYIDNGLLQPDNYIEIIVLRNINAFVYNDITETAVNTVNNRLVAYSSQQLDIGDYVKLKKYKTGSEILYSNSYPYNASNLVDYVPQGSEAINIGHYGSSANYIDLLSGTAAIKWVSRNRATGEEAFPCALTISLDDYYLQEIYLLVQNPYALFGYEDYVEFDGNLVQLQARTAYDLAEIMGGNFFKLSVHILAENGGFSPVNIADYLQNVRFSHISGGAENILMTVGSDLSLVYGSYNIGSGNLSWKAVYKLYYGEGNDEYVELTAPINVRMLPLNYNGFFDRTEEYAGVIEKTGTNNYSLFNYFNAQFISQTIQENSITNINVDLTVPTVGFALSFAFADENSALYASFSLDGKSLVLNDNLGNGKDLLINATVTYPNDFTYVFAFRLLAKYPETVTVQYPFVEKVVVGENVIYEPLKESEEGIFYEPIVPDKTVNLFNADEKLKVTRIKATNKSGNVAKTLKFKTTNYLLILNNGVFTTTGDITRVTIASTEYFRFNKVTGEVIVTNDALCGYFLTFEAVTNNNVSADYNLYVANNYHYSYTKDYAGNCKEVVASSADFEIDFLATQSGERLYDISIKDIDGVEMFNKFVVAYVYDASVNNFVKLNNLKYVHPGNVYAETYLTFAFMVYDIANDGSIVYVGNYDICLKPDIELFYDTDPESENHIEKDGDYYIFTIPSKVENLSRDYDILSLITLTYDIDGTGKQQIDPIIMAPALTEDDLISFGANSVQLIKFASSVVSYDFVLKYKLGTAGDDSDCYLLNFKIVIEPDIYFIDAHTVEGQTKYYSTKEGAFEICPPRGEISYINLTEFINANYLNSGVLLNGWNIIESPTGTEGYDNSTNLVNINISDLDEGAIPARSVLVAGSVSETTYVRINIITDFGATQYIWVKILPDIQTAKYLVLVDEEDEEKGFLGERASDSIASSVNSNPELIFDERQAGSAIVLTDYIRLVHNDLALTEYHFSDWKVSTLLAEDSGFVLAFENGIVYFPHMNQNKVMALKVEVKYNGSKYFSYFATVYVTLCKTYDITNAYIVDGASYEYVIAGRQEDDYSNTQIENFFGSLNPVTLGMNNYRLRVMPVENGIQNLKLSDINKGVNQLTLQPSSATVFRVNGSAVKFVNASANSYLQITNKAGVNLQYNFVIYSATSSKDELTVDYPQNSASQVIDGETYRYLKIKKSDLDGTFGNFVIISNLATSVGKLFMSDDMYSNLKIISIYNSQQAAMFDKNGSVYTNGDFTITVSEDRKITLYNSSIQVDEPKTLILKFVNDMGYLGEYRFLILPDVEFAASYSAQGESYETIYGATEGEKMVDLDNPSQNRFSIFVKGSTHPDRFDIMLNYNESQGTFAGYEIEYSTNTPDLVEFNGTNFKLRAVGDARLATIFVTIKYNSINFATFEYKLRVINHLDIDMPYARSNTLDVYLSNKTLANIGSAKYTGIWEAFMPNGSAASPIDDLNAKGIVPTANTSSTYFFMPVADSERFDIFIENSFENNEIVLNLAPAPAEYWDSSVLNELAIKGSYNEYVFASLRDLSRSSQMPAYNMRFSIDYNDEATTITQDSNITLSEDGVLTIAGDLSSPESIAIFIRTIDWQITGYYEKYILNLFPSTGIAVNSAAGGYTLHANINGKDYAISGTNDANLTHKSLSDFSMLKHEAYNPNTTVGVPHIAAYKTVVTLNKTAKTYGLSYVNANNKLSYEQQLSKYTDFDGFKESAPSASVNILSGGNYVYTVPLVAGGDNYVAAIQITASQLENDIVNYHYLYISNDIAIQNVSDNKFDMKTEIGYSSDYYYHLLAMSQADSIDYRPADQQGTASAQADDLFGENKHSSLMFLSTVTSTNAFRKFVTHLDYNFSSISGTSLTAQALKERFELIYVIKEIDESEVVTYRMTNSLDDITEDTVITDLYLKLLANSAEMFRNKLIFDFDFVDKTSTVDFQSFEQMSMTAAQELKGKYNVGLTTHLGFTKSSLGTYRDAAIIGVIQDNNATLDLLSDTEQILGLIENQGSIVLSNATFALNLNRSTAGNVTDKLYKITATQTIENAIYKLEREFYVLCSKSTNFIFNPYLLNNWYTPMQPRIAGDGFIDSTLKLDFASDVKIVDASADNVAINPNWYDGQYIVDIENQVGVWTVTQNPLNMASVQITLSETQSKYILTLDPAALKTWSDSDSSKIVEIEVKLSFALVDIIYKMQITVNKPV